MTHNYMRQVQGQTISLDDLTEEEFCLEVSVCGRHT